MISNSPIERTFNNIDETVNYLDRMYNETRHDSNMPSRIHCSLKGKKYKKIKCEFNHRFFNYIAGMDPQLVYSFKASKIQYFTKRNGELIAEMKVMLSGFNQEEIENTKDIFSNRGFRPLFIVENGISFPESPREKSKEDLR